MEPGLYHMDCMEALRSFPDKFFDLAIVDPPYGGGYTGGDPEDLAGGADWQRAKRGRFGGWFDRYHIAPEADTQTGGGTDGSGSPDALHGGGADWQQHARGRWGQRFDRYHIGGSDGRDVGGEVRPERGRLR